MHFNPWPVILEMKKGKPVLLPQVIITKLFSFVYPSNLSLLYASSLLCFSSPHIVGSLTSKLPSIIIQINIYIYINIVLLVLFGGSSHESCSK